jgi:hypothetical protein
MDAIDETRDLIQVNRLFDGVLIFGTEHNKILAVTLSDTHHLLTDDLINFPFQIFAEIIRVNLIHGRYSGKQVTILAGRTAVSA